MPILEICRWIEATQLGTAIPESVWVFPIILGFHSLGLSVSVGTVLWFDLRLLGVKMRAQPVSEVYRQLMPYMLTGFGVMFASGILLFSAQASHCYENAYCRSKILLLLLPGVNALVYHLVTTRTIRVWDKDSVPPRPARAAGWISILSWVAIIVLGRQIEF